MSRPHIRWNGRTNAWEVLGPGGTKVLEVGGDYIAKGKGDHLYLDTSRSDKTVRINNRTYVATASIVGFQSMPRAGINMISDIIGGELQPGINAGFKSSQGIAGLKLSPRIRATTGSLGGQVRCLETQLESDSGYANTIEGPASCVRAINNMHGNVTRGVYLIYAVTHGGNKAWNGFAAFPDDNGLAKVASIGGGTAYVKCLIGSTSYGLVANEIT